MAFSSKARDTLTMRKSKGFKDKARAEGSARRGPSSRCPVEVSDHLGQKQDSDTAGDEVVASTGHLSICMTDTQLKTNYLPYSLCVNTSFPLVGVMGE